MMTKHENNQYPITKKDIRLALSRRQQDQHLRLGIITLIKKYTQTITECQILKQLYIIKLLSLIAIIIYTTSQSITCSLGTVVEQPLLQFNCTIWFTFFP